MLKKIALIAGLGLAGCVEVTTPTPAPKPEVTQPAPVPNSLKAKLGRVDRVLKKVAPVAFRVCEENRRDKPKSFCDFQYFVDDNEKQPANAFQAVDRRGRPVIVFNINLVKTLRNEHEIAFILAHEAGHQIARHLERRQKNQIIGAVLGGVIASASGASPLSGVMAGAEEAFFVFSKPHELEADQIGTYISHLAGYNPTIGVKSLNLFPKVPNGRNVTHPASPDRIRLVNETYQKILRGG